VIRGVRLDLDEPTLLIADTHIGIEVDLARRGIRVVSQLDKLVRDVVEWGEELGAKRLVVLGDVKHEYSPGGVVSREVRRFVEEVGKRFDEVILVMGNHDGGLQEIVEGGAKVVSSRGFLVEAGGRRILFLHGHAKPERDAIEAADVIVMGHHHPSATLRDEVGFVTRVPAIVKLQVDKREICRKLSYGECSGRLSIVILPAAHPLITGTDVSMLPVAAREMRSLLNYVPVESVEGGEVYMVDYTFLGFVKDFAKVEEIDYDYEK